MYVCVCSSLIVCVCWFRDYVYVCVCVSMSEWRVVKTSTSTESGCRLWVRGDTEEPSTDKVRSASANVNDKIKCGKTTLKWIQKKKNLTLKNGRQN